MPDTIGGDASAPSSGLGSDPSTAVAGEAGDAVEGDIVTLPVFETAQVEAGLDFVFDFAAKRFKSDHWKLGSTSRSMLGGPTTALVNRLVNRFNELLPDMMAVYFRENPELYAFLIVLGIVLVPRATKQWQISKTRAAKPLEKPAGSETDSSTTA